MSEVLRRYGPGLFGWGRYQERWRFDFNGHALVCGAPDAGTVLIVDPIAPTDAELAALGTLGRRFLVVLLNSDHERDAARVAAALQAETVYAPRADLGGVGVEGAVGYDDGHVFGGGWRAIGLSDLKTPGEMVLLHPAKRVLVVGDAVVGDPLNGMRLVPPMKIADRAAALGSLRSLLDLDFDTLLCSDGYCLAQGGKAVLEAFLGRSE